MLFVSTGVIALETIDGEMGVALREAINVYPVHKQACGLTPLVLFPSLTPFFGPGLHYMAGLTKFFPHPFNSVSQQRTTKTCVGRKLRY